MEPQKALYEELSSTSGLRSETSLRDESRRRTGAEGSLRSDFDFTQTSGHQDQASSSVILNIIRMYENCRGRESKKESGQFDPLLASGITKMPLIIIIHFNLYHSFRFTPKLYSEVLVYESNAKRAPL